MRNRGTRLAALEAKKSTGWEAVHMIGYHEGADEAECQANREAAINAYGRDKIQPDDLLIETVFVAPRFDENGKLIPRPYKPQGLTRGVTL